jgi:hypothetical protein
MLGMITMLTKMVYKNVYAFEYLKYLRDRVNKVLVSDERYIRNTYRKALGRNLELQHPTLYNDKINFLKLNWTHPFLTMCADKVAVRDFVKERIGANYLVPILGIFDNVDDIDFNVLPKSFVIKASHGSGWIIIVKDKDSENLDLYKKRMRLWLKSNYYFRAREKVYKDIPPRIIIEPFLKINDNPPDDYRIFCFHGEPRFIFLDMEKYEEDHIIKRNVYDINWNLLDVKVQYPCLPNKKIEKPKELDLLVSLSKKLSKDFLHVRVDFYSFDGLVYFGELTFFHGSGFQKINPSRFEKEMGDLVDLNQINIDEFSDI